MTIAIVVSRADSASEHIGEHLLDMRDWSAHEDDSLPDAEGGGTYYRSGPFELRFFDDLHIYLSDPAAAFGGDTGTDGDDGDDPDLLVFVSRHSGDTGPLLTGHFTGNFGAAEFGGDDHELAPAAPSALSVLVSAMAAHAPEGYDVGIEGTHHGPTDVSCPSLFAEVGSGQEQWADPGAARAVAQAVLALRGVDPHREKQLVGVGGGHYAPRFGRVIRETPWAVGHVASDWQLEALGDPNSGGGRGVLRQAFEESEAHLALFDGDYPRAESVVEDLGYRVVSETWVREVADRPLALVEHLEELLSPVEEGLRFGGVEPAVGSDDLEATDLAVVDLPDDLLTAAQGIDPAATREAVEAATVAFETVESGTRARGRAAIADESDREVLVESLAAVLRESYDGVEVTDDAVVAREVAFDPALAAELGVPEGPAWGRLADGEAVTVDGRDVRPEDVRTERRTEFPV